MIKMDRTQLTTPPPSFPPPLQAPALHPLPPALPQTHAAGKASAIETMHLTKRYGPLVALDTLSLRLEQGDVFGFIGPNGAGKSTTMKILAGLLQPTAGSATVLGKNVITNGEF